MQGSRSNGKSIAMIGIVALVAVLALWLITDTLFTIGLIVAVGLFFGGMILMMMDSRKAA